MRKIRQKNYEYGECEMCDTPLTERYIRQDFWIRGKLIVIDHVLAGVCPECGEKVVNAETGQHIMKLLQDSEYIAKSPHISVPSVRFDEFIEKYAA